MIAILIIVTIIFIIIIKEIWVYSGMPYRKQIFSTTEYGTKPLGYNNTDEEIGDRLSQHLYETWKYRYSLYTGSSVLYGTHSAHYYYRGVVDKDKNILVETKYEAIRVLENSQKEVFIIGAPNRDDDERVFYKIKDDGMKITVERIEETMARETFKEIIVH